MAFALNEQNHIITILNIKKNIAKAVNAVPCHYLMKDHYECYVC